MGGHYDDLRNRNYKSLYKELSNDYEELKKEYRDYKKSLKNIEENANYCPICGNELEG